MQNPRIPGPLLTLVIRNDFRSHEIRSAVDKAFQAKEAPAILVADKAEVRKGSLEGYNKKIAETREEIRLAEEELARVTAEPKRLKKEAEGDKELQECVLIGLEADKKAVQLAAEDAERMAAHYTTVAMERRNEEKTISCDIDAKKRNNAKAYAEALEKIERVNRGMKGAITIATRRLSRAKKLLGRLRRHRDEEEVRRKGSAVGPVVLQEETQCESSGAPQSAEGMNANTQGGLE